MDGRLSRRRAGAVLWALPVVAAALPLIVNAEPAHAQAGSGDWQPCGSTTAGDRIEYVEILLALDRSGSLENVDPTGTRRRRAVRGMREGLSRLQDSLQELLSAPGVGADLAIDVSLVAFNTTGETVAGFARVGADHPSDRALEEALDSAGNTDYGPAIQRALEQFESSPNADAGSTCRILVLFTDGIQDPYGTAGGRRPASENQAVAHVSNLLTDLCDTSSGDRRYRKRLEDLGVSTYVAVLRGPNFSRGGDATHLDILASASKQTILALTGHGDSPLLDDVAAAPACGDWSAIRAGKVIEIEEIGALTDELANAVGDVGLAVRQPRLRCTTEPEARLVGEWPQSLAVRSPQGERLCTVSSPLDGETILTLSGQDSPPGVEWLIDNGSEQDRSRRLVEGDADLSFDIVSTLLPGDGAAGGAGGAGVQVLMVWRPEPQPGWPEQPPEVRLATTVRFDVPDREQQWVDRLIDCRVHRRATWVDVASGVRAEARELCTVQAPPAGEFEIALTPADRNRLLWSATRAVVGGDPTEAPGDDRIRLEPGDASVSLGGHSGVLNSTEIPLETFADSVRFRLQWRSPLGALLVDQTVADVEVEVRPASVDLLQCTDEAQVTAAVEDAAGAAALVVDTGCTLLSQSRGTVTAKVAGDLRGVNWQLVDPPPTAGESWPTRDVVALAQSEPDRRLFVGIGPLELAELTGVDVEFALVATWSEQGLETAEREPRRLAVYLPALRCADRVEAARVDVEPPGGAAAEERARARGLCRIDSPPNGHLEIRIADAKPAVALSWQPARAGDVADGDVLRVAAGSEEITVDAMTRPLAPELIRQFEDGVDVEVVWRSARGHVSESRRRVAVDIPEQAPVLLECASAPRMLGAGGPVPEGPMVVDTGCVLLAPELGMVTLEVEGSIAGVPWRPAERIRLEPGDANRPILIETAGLLPNEDHDVAARFEAVARLTVDRYESPDDRRQRTVAVQLVRRIQIHCERPPEVLNASVEVPEGPLVVDTGCTLLAPSAGTVTVSVAGGIAGVPWDLAGEVRLGAGDDDQPIHIATTAPLQNRQYDTVAEFGLTATWRAPDGGEQGVGEQPLPGQAPPRVVVALRARPDTGAAALISVGLLLAGIVAAWLVLWRLGRRTNRPPRPQEYRVVRHEVTAVVAAGGQLELADFGDSAAVTGSTDPVGGRRSRLEAQGLTISARVRWWNPRDLLDGGRAAAIPQGRRGLLVVASPSAGRPDWLPVNLADGAVIVAVARVPTAPRTGSSEHRGHIWILIRPTTTQAATEQAVQQNLANVRRELGRRLGGGRAAPTPVQPKG